MHGFCDSVTAVISMFRGGLSLGFWFVYGSHRFLSSPHTLLWPTQQLQDERVKASRAFLCTASIISLTTGLSCWTKWTASTSELWETEAAEAATPLQTDEPLDALRVLQGNEWGVARSSFPLGQRSACSPFVSFPLKANAGYTLS